MTNAIYIKNRKDKHKKIKEAIFMFSGGQKSLLIRGEGQEISTVVEIAEILKHKLYPTLEVANISLGSRPYYNRKRRRNKRNRNDKFNKNIISKIEILLEKSYI
ncbi:MAG: ribonuclease P subunit p25 family protein [Promethearchaeia archaeon]